MAQDDRSRPRRPPGALRKCDFFDFFRVPRPHVTKRNADCICPLPSGRFALPLTLPFRVPHSCVFQGRVFLSIQPRQGRNKVAHRGSGGKPVLEQREAPEGRHNPFRSIHAQPNAIRTSGQPLPLTGILSDAEDWLPGRIGGAGQKGLMAIESSHLPTEPETPCG